MVEEGGAGRAGGGFYMGAGAFVCLWQPGEHILSAAFSGDAAKQGEWGEGIREVGCRESE